MTRPSINYYCLLSNMYVGKQVSNVQLLYDILIETLYLTKKNCAIILNINKYHVCNQWTYKISKWREQNECYRPTRQLLLLKNFDLSTKINYGIYLRK